jgi:hypothetical protein
VWKNLVGKHKGKRQLWRLRHKIEMDLEVLECGVCSGHDIVTNSVLFVNGFSEYSDIQQTKKKKIKTPWL